jgi:hypothetical protein
MFSGLAPDPSVALVFRRRRRGHRRRRGLPRFNPSRARRKRREMQLHADKGITLNCDGSCPYLSGAVEDWGVEDPTDQPLEKVRQIRDDMALPQPTATLSPRRMAPPSTTSA